MGEIVSDKVAYKRYLTVFDREVEFAAEDAPEDAPHRVAYDIVGHPKSNFQFTVVFPFHPATAADEPQVTLIREYIQASNAMGYSLPTGSFDPAKHATLADAAVDELAEEARLRGRDDALLADPSHPGSSSPSGAPTGSNRTCAWARPKSPSPRRGTRRSFPSRWNGWGSIGCAS